MRKRYLEGLLKEDLTWSRVVSILGMRQSGKTTLLKKVSRRYLTLDSPEVSTTFAKGDWTALDHPPSFPLALDEAQLQPGLFPQIKMRADEINRPGLFILTGSVRFLALRQIRESLTGRTSILELLPMTLAETHERPLHDLVTAILKHEPKNLLERLSARAWCSPASVNRFLACGGMPGVCFKRNEKIRNRSWSAHLDTVLSRDIQLLRATETPLLALRELYSELARSQGEPLNVAVLARKVGVSSPTLKHLLSAFEGLFLIRRLGDTHFCEDPGLASFAAGGRGMLSPRTHLLRLVFFELNAQMRYLHDPGSRMGNFKTRGGAYVPFILEIPRLGRVAITIDTGPHASDKSLRSLTAYQKRNRLARVLCIHQGVDGTLSARNGVPCIPSTWMF